MRSSRLPFLGEIRVRIANLDCTKCDLIGVPPAVGAQEESGRCLLRPYILRPAQSRCIILWVCGITRTSCRLRAARACKAIIRAGSTGRGLQEVRVIPQTHKMMHLL